MLGGFLSPANDHYGKRGLLAASRRLAMCELAVQQSHWLRVDAWESLQPQYQRTHVVAERLESILASYCKAPVQVFLACGVDFVHGMSDPNRWKPDSVRSLLKVVRVLVLPRDGDALHRHTHDSLWQCDNLRAFRDRFTSIDGWQCNVSSSLLRCVCRFVGHVTACSRMNELLIRRACYIHCVCFARDG